MPSPKSNHPVLSSSLRVGPGWVTFCAFEPDFENLTKGGILIASQLGIGKHDHSQTVWGRVYRMGSYAGRGDCVPINPEIERREEYPLPFGSWICCRKANHHTFKLSFQAVQVHDVIMSWPADYTWAQIVDEVNNAREKLFKE